MVTTGLMTVGGSSGRFGLALTVVRGSHGGRRAERGGEGGEGGVRSFGFAAMTVRDQRRRRGAGGGKSSFEEKSAEYPSFNHFEGRQDKKVGGEDRARR